jgi:hypothetical protein
VFSKAGFGFNEHRKFREWLWVHFAVSAAVTAQQLISGTPRKEVYANKNHSMEGAVRAVRETMPVLSARGVRVDEHPELTFFNQPEIAVADSLRKLLMNRAFQAAIDGHAHPEELIRMFSDVLDESHRLSIPVPTFDAAKAFVN